MTGAQTRPTVPPQLLVVGGAASLQTGSALATLLFPVLGAAGVLALRMGVGAAFLWFAGKAWQRRPSRAHLPVVVAFGTVLGAMNLSFYLALERIPLGATVALELLGPLAVAVAGSRRARDLLWVLLAAAGVAVLTNPATSGLDPAGVGFALLAGACWAGYILLGSRVATTIPGTSGLAWGMVAASLWIVPLGVVTAGTALLDPGALAAGMGVAALSSALPYSLELMALRRVSAQAFGIMMSLQPAVATLAGLLVAGQRPGVATLTGIALVVVASLGAVPARGGRAARRAGRAPPSAYDDRP